MFGDLGKTPKLRYLPNEVREISLKAAQRMVVRYHELHRAPIGHRFSLGIYTKGEPSGCMIFGRPVARFEDQETTLELSRIVIFPSPEESEAAALCLAETWIKKHKPGFVRLIAYKEKKYGYSHAFYDAGWELEKIGTMHPHGWANREGRIEDCGDVKLKYVRVLK